MKGKTFGGENDFQFIATVNTNTNSSLILLNIDETQGLQYILYIDGNGRLAWLNDPTDDIAFDMSHYDVEDLITNGKDHIISVAYTSNN